MLRRIQGRILQSFERLGLRIERLKPRPIWPGEQTRLTYQQRYVTFPIAPGDRVLDVGSGGFPFPLATVHLDGFPDFTPTRYEPLARVEKPFVTGDVHRLPFRDHSFEFVYASHLLQSVDDPLAACAEMMRVGKAGYIELPTFGKVTLFSWGSGLLLKWYAIGIHQHLCFFEYTDRELEGIRSPIWRDLIMSRWYEPLQAAFYDNQDIFNTMFSWTGSFSVSVFGRDGSVRTLNTQAELNPHGRNPAHSERFAEFTGKARGS
jgi:SAM-dependent methyltransferase